jgi:hypothetical protein
MNLAEFKQQNPDYADVPDERLATALHRKFYSDMPYVDFAKKVGLSGPNPATEFGGLPFRPAGIDTGLTMPEKFSRSIAGAGKAIADTVRGVSQNRDALKTIPFLAPTMWAADRLIPASTQTQATVDESRKLDAPLMKTREGFAGNLVSNVGLTAATAPIPGVNTLRGAGLTGAAFGALQPTASGESRGLNTAIGAGAGVLGQGVGNVIGRAVSPVRNQLTPELQRLAGVAQQQGIPLNAAQQTGSRPLQIIDSVMENLPFTAGPQAAQRQAQQTAYNSAVARTFGQNANEVTPQVLGQARQDLGQQFTDLSARNAVNVDNRFLTRLANAQNDAQRHATQDVAGVVDNYIDDILAHVNGNAIPGRAYRELDSAIGRTIRGTGNGDLRQHLGQVRTALREGMDNSIGPADQAAWRQARQQYANLMTVAPIAARSEAGNISGRTLLGAANTGNRNARFGGPSDLADLGRVGRAFVADQIPNSGTAQRQLYQGLLTGGLGGIGYASTEDPAKAAGFAALGLLGPRALQMGMNSGAGQAYLTNQVINAQRQELLNNLMRAGLLSTAIPMTTSGAQ